MSAVDSSYFDVGREALHAEYISALRKGGLVIQRCPSCSATYFPPVVRCGACGGGVLEWVNADNGTAVVAFVGTDKRVATVIVEVAGCRLAAVADADSITPGSTVERVDVREDDRVPRIGVVSP
jgi:uncharacterized OB-fold protein